jgi:hypothetical protein
MTAPREFTPEAAQEAERGVTEEAASPRIAQ